MEDTVKEKNYSIETFLCDAVLLVLALFCIALITWDCHKVWILGDVDQTSMKILVFLILDVFLARISYRVVKNKSQRTQICVVATTAVVITVGSILLNNMWHYIYMFWNFDWLKKLSFWWVVREDITYLYGLGLYRYAFVCLGYIVSFIVLKKEWISRILDCVLNDKVLHFLGLEIVEEEEEEE